MPDTLGLGQTLKEPESAFVALNAGVDVVCPVEGPVVSQVVFKVGNLHPYRGGVCGHALDVRGVFLAFSARKTVQRSEYLGREAFALELVERDLAILHHVVQHRGDLGRLPIH
jgi:hypothetical protein